MTDELTTERKTELFNKAITTRQGRVVLAFNAVGKKGNPCKGCGHEGSPTGCNDRVHKDNKRRNPGCWHPGGTLAVGCERKGCRRRR